MNAFDAPVMFVCVITFDLMRCCRMGRTLRAVQHRCASCAVAGWAGRCGQCSTGAPQTVSASREAYDVCQLLNQRPGDGLRRHQAFFLMHASNLCPAPAHARGATSPAWLQASTRDSDSCHIAGCACTTEDAGARGRQGVTMGRLVLPCSTEGELAPLALQTLSRH